MTQTTHPLARTLRALGWPQSELARRSGVSQSTISFVLAGKRGGRFSPASAQKILDALASATEVSERARRLLLRLGLKHLVFPPTARSRA